MLYQTLIIIKDKINQYLQKRFSLTENVLVMTNVVEVDGSVSPEVENKLILTLVNIKEESVLKNIPPNVYSEGSHLGLTNKPTHFNLYILFSANYSGIRYEDAMKFLSEVLYYFQAVPYFNHSNMPELDPNIEKLVFEVVNLDFADLSHLWSVMGGKYLPSILYKVRLIRVDSSEINSDAFIAKGNFVNLKKDN